MHIDPKIVTTLLCASTSGLKELAQASGLDTFDFYRGALLRGLDLSGQDLRGLNFDKADLRGSQLDNALFEAGSFNGSLIDAAYSDLQDKYVFYAEEVVRHPAKDILLFARFRDGFVENAVRGMGFHFQRFAELIGLGTNSLRKARLGDVIAIETAVKIVNGINKHGQNPLIGDVAELSLMRQPLVQLLSGGNNSRFKTVERDEYLELLAMRKAAVEFHEHTRRTRHDRWRDTPEVLRWWHDNVLPPEWRIS